MWRNKRWPARREAGTRMESRATRGEGEQEVEAALCTAAAGEGIVAAAGVRAEEQRGLGEEDEREK
jgi:hypothetical protein